MADGAYAMVQASTPHSLAPALTDSPSGLAAWILETAKGWVGHSHVPTGIALFAKDSTHAPREWAQRFFNVQRYTELPRGGHFAAFEEPQLLAEDLRAFFRPLHAS